MREDGMRLDRLLLTTSSSFTPSGTGPPESVFASNALSSEGAILAMSYDGSAPELPLLFESDLLKSINVVAWNRNLRLFPDSTRQKP
jgi:hypothetical protein